MPGLRRIAVGIVVGALAVALVATVAVAVIVRRPLPDYSGTVQVQGPSAPITVLRDERGVPQVRADTSADLFFGQGYVHAQDRFFEMDFRRHVTAGRLSELVGEDEDALAADAAIRTMGWRRVAEQEIAILDPATRALLQAYADGVNAYIGSRSPTELSAAYPILELQIDLERIEPWTPVDSLTWLKAIAWDLRSNYTDELARALSYGAVEDITLVQSLFPPEVSENQPILPSGSTAGASLAGALAADAAGADGSRAARSGPDGSGPDRSGEGDATGADATPDVTPSRADAVVLDSVATSEQTLTAVAEALGAIPDLVGSGEGVGSNSWVVSGQHTESGKPLLANDPHLAPSMPSTWYQVGLQCNEVGPECPYDVSGFSFAGLPGVVIGHNDRIAWGFTNLYPDVTDFFLEDIRGDAYVRDGQQVPLETTQETIRVAGGDDVDITIRSTVHGPIVSDVIDTLADVGRAAPTPENTPSRARGYAVSLAWTALKPGRTADAIFALNRAQGWEDLREAARLFEVPAQNMVYADVDGSIGYQAPGTIPVRSGPGLGQADGTWPRPGWDSTWDWQGTIPFESLPSQRDPDDGFIVAANQKVSADSPEILSRDYDYGYRAQRIREMIEEAIEVGRPLSVQDMTAMQLDTSASFTSPIVDALLSAPLAGETQADRQFTAEAVDLLRDWDFTQETDSPAAAYFNAVWRNVLRLTFADQLPVDARPSGGSRWFAVVSNLIEQPNSAWWDNVSTPTVVETRDQVLAEALRDARLELTAALGKDPDDWEWGKLHTLTLEQQPLGGPSVPGAVRALFNEGPRELPGSSSVVQANGYDASESYEVRWVPSMRMVVDLDDLDSSTWVDLTGVSGHPWSGHYGDQSDAWARGDTFPWPFTAEAVQAAAEDTLVIEPVDR